MTPEVSFSVVEFTDNYFYLWLKVAAIYAVCFSIILAITRRK